jgi:DNA (cytosine-5)-methyltransferase 1
MADRFENLDPKSDFDVFDPKRDWEIESILDDSHNISGCELTDSELLWLEAWEEFVQIMRPAMAGRHLPGFPIWADSWLDFREVRRIKWSKPNVSTPRSVTLPRIDESLPKWKKSHLRKNHDMFARHFKDLIPWAARWGVFTDAFPASRRKLEWQAQETKELKDCLIHLRPSGIRAKRANYLPALVAITQTSIVGPRERRLSPRETARLQGLPDTFVFRDQPPSATYKQMGNGVNVGAVWHIFRKHVQRDAELLLDAPYKERERRAAGARIVEAVEAAPLRPNEILAKHRPAVG